MDDMGPEVARASGRQPELRSLEMNLLIHHDIFRGQIGEINTQAWPSGHDSHQTQKLSGEPEYGGRRRRMLRKKRWRDGGFVDASSDHMSGLAAGLSSSQFDLNPPDLTMVSLKWPDGGICG
jgi:hypothetical protein